MQVELVNNMPMQSVACVNRETGTIFVNEPLFRRYTPFEQQFILLHEEGHYRLGTQSEFDADAYAFDRLVGTQSRSLLQLCEALEHTLPFSSAEHHDRVHAQLVRALVWDAAHGNPQAARALRRLSTSYTAEETAMLAVLTKSMEAKLKKDEEEAQKKKEQAEYWNGKWEDFKALPITKQAGYIGGGALLLLALFFVVRKLMRRRR
jgi:hypothetical protein